MASARVNGISRTFEIPSAYRTVAGLSTWLGSRKVIAQQTISIAAEPVTALLLNPKVPANNLKELVALAKANPGKLNWASSGNGTGGHLGQMVFSKLAGIRFTHVPFKGAGPASLTVANDLRPLGYEVTIFEKQAKPGGLMRSNIPSFRLPEKVLDDECSAILDMGCEIHYNSPVGSLRGLLDQKYDAIFVGTGAGLPTFMNVPGEHLLGGGIHFHFQLTQNGLRVAFQESHGIGHILRVLLLADSIHARRRAAVDLVQQLLYYLMLSLHHIFLYLLL